MCAGNKLVAAGQRRRGAGPFIKIPLCGGGMEKIENCAQSSTEKGLMMDNKGRKRLRKYLPGKLKAIYEVYLRGKICECAKQDIFFHDNGTISRLQGESFSQSGQDKFIYWMVFGEGYKGFFLDVGGNDPIEINNTYFLERKGWTGMAFEPVKEQADKWEGVRETPCHNVALGDEEGEVEFTEMSGSAFSGIGVSKFKLKDFTEVSTYKVKQRTLANVLKEKEIRHVDFVSVDVEGYEMNVLRGIDFEAVDITCFCIENDRDGAIMPDIDLRKFMVKKGYRLVGRIAHDDIFIKENYFG